MSSLHGSPEMGINFLSLPYQVRKQISLLAGVVRFCPVNIATKNMRTLHRVIDPFEASITETIQQRLNSSCPYRLKIFKYMSTQNTTGINKDAECICPPLPYQLLRVSHQTSLEIFDLLYSQNKFKVDLAIARYSLTPLAYSKMTSLQIRLTACSCITGHQCGGSSFAEGVNCSICHPACWKGSEPPLSLADRESEKRLSCW